MDVEYQVTILPIYLCLHHVTYLPTIYWSYQLHHIGLYEILIPIFSPFNHYATCLFQLIHLDLKTFPVISYYQQKYIIIFYDDFTLYRWISVLTTKDKAIQATKHL